MSALLDRAQAALDAKVKRHMPPEPERRSADGCDAADLVACDMPELVGMCRPWVVEGLTLVVGRPKIGKTTLLRQLGVALNVGGDFLGSHCAHTDVLFLSLEEGKRLMRSKLKRMGVQTDQLRGIRLEFEWPQGPDGAAYLRQWLAQRKGERPVVIIIDSLTRFRTPPSDRGHAFTEDYNAAKSLADLCKDFPGLAVLVLHHTTKALHEDPVAAISGTYGLSAAADNYLILLKQGQQFRLHAGGRSWDRDESDFELAREAGGWRLTGTWDTDPAAKLTGRQAEVMALLKGGAKGNKTLAESTGQSASALSHLMRSMEERGLVVRVANGWGIAR